MNAIKEYRKALMETIDKAFDTQEENLRAAAELLKEATLTGHNIFGFGCSHAAQIFFLRVKRLVDGLHKRFTVFLDGIHTLHPPFISREGGEKLFSRFFRRISFVQ